MNKRELIEAGKAFLNSKGINEIDYVISLQGPTIFFTKDVKLEPEVKKKLKEGGFKFYGG